MAPALSPSPSHFPVYGQTESHGSKSRGVSSLLANAVQSSKTSHIMLDSKAQVLFSILTCVCVAYSTGLGGQVPSESLVSDIALFL